MPVSRRSLLAGGIALSAAAAEAVKLPRKIRVAILGFDGHVSEITSPLPQLPDVEITAICDASPSVLARQAKNPRLAGAHQYRDHEEMLRREQLDVVAVCNKNSERAGAVLACVERGLNVVAEKPLAISRADYMRVKQAVTAKKVSLGLLLPMRYTPQYAALKRIVDSGAIGEVVQISSQKSYKAAGSPPWRRERSTYGSTILWIGIHMIDLMRWSSGREFMDATAWQTRVGMPELKDQENVSASVFRLDNGGFAILRMDYLRPETAPTHGDDRLRLAGTKGVAEYMAATGVTLVTAGEKPQTLTDLPSGGDLFIDYLQATYNGKAPTISLPDIWRVNEITIAAHESAEKGQTVRIA
jgi:predicted dehydrogenase